MISGQSGRLGQGPGEPVGRLVPQGPLRAGGVVIDSPAFDFLAGSARRIERIFVQAFIAEFPVEALYRGILRRLSWLDIAQPVSMTKVPGDPRSYARPVP